MSKIVSNQVCKFVNVTNLQMSDVKKIVNFIPDMDIKTVKWVNEQHKRIGIRARSLVENAINIGMVLYKVQDRNSRDFVRWIENNFDFSVKTAYNYILLFIYKDEIAEARNLSEAYRITNKLTTERKQKEEKKAEQRVADYKETGKKSKDWRRGTDDKKAKEKVEQKTKKEGKTETVGTKKNKKQETTETKKQEKREAQETVSTKKEEKKEGIDQDIDLFIKSLDEFISGLSNKSFKIGACQSIIKKCKSMMDELV